MSAHPMIQPVSWTDEDHPDVVAQNLPADRAAIYSIVWHSSLACVMKPPLLTHVRYVWSTPADVKIAVASVQPVAGKEGYLLERQDHPPVKWPVNRGNLETMTLVKQAQTRIETVTLCLRLGPSSGEMIQGVFDAGITTPASISKLFSRLLGHPGLPSSTQKPVAFVKFIPTEMGVQARLTSGALIRLRQWKASGVLGRVSERNNIVNSVEKAELSSRDALRQLCALRGLPAETSPNNLSNTLTDTLAPLADLVALQIDAMCDKWQGMTTAGSLFAKTEITFAPPKLQALPKWIDPEIQLPPDHPLRALRVRMECDLAMTEPAWSVIEPSKRAELRLQWLTKHSAEIAGSAQKGGGEYFEAAMHPLTGRFGALRYWLTGLEVGTD